MKKQIIFAAFLLITALLVHSCTKDDTVLEKNTEEESINVRSGKQIYIEHSPEEFAYIQHVRNRVNALNHFDLGVDFENIKGQPDWDLAVVPYKSSGVFKSLLVPIIKDEEINAIFHVFDGSVLTYHYVDESLLNEPFYSIGGPANHKYEQVFIFYNNLLNDTPLDSDGDYDDTFDDPEMGGCTQVTTIAVPCTDLGHMPGEFCRCQTPYFFYCERAYWIQSTDLIDCGLNDTSLDNNYSPEDGDGFTGGGGNNNNNTNNNNGDPNLLLAYQYLYSVCPIISNEACIYLEFIVENVNSIQCQLGIAMQVANLLENPTPSNIAAANCYIMNTAVQQYTSAPNTCSNPFSSTPMSDFAEMYNEMNSSLLSWATSYPGLDNIPCDLTVAGYSSDEKNQILQAFKDYLGNAPGIGVNDNNPPNNPEMDNVNALNALFSTHSDPAYIPFINWFLSKPEYIGYISELKQKQISYVLADIKSGSEEWSGPELEDVEEIDNGIFLEFITPYGLGGDPGRKVAFTDYRHPHDPAHGIIAPDMSHGANGNTSLISDYNKPLLTFTDDQLFDNLQSLVESFSIFGWEDVGEDYVVRFESSVGGDYYNEQLSTLIAGTNTMRNFMKNFGSEVETSLAYELSLQNAVIDYQLGNITMPLQSLRPIFNAKYLRGEKILINDTEYTEIYVDNFLYDDNTGEWSGWFVFDIFDHFGLDNTDLTTFQNEKLLNAGKGFASWWILQHARNYKPFRTKIRISAKLIGNIND